MDWETYRAQCDAGDVLSRWMLQQTRDLLIAASRPALARRLETALEQTPIEKPPDHRAGPASDFFVVRLSVAEANEVLAVVARAKARGARTAPPERRGLGGFEEAWREYVGWLTGAHPRSLWRGG